MAKPTPNGETREGILRAALRRFAHSGYSAASVQQIVGDAQVSEKHCNFLINLGNATAADIESLGEEVRSRVFQKSGVLLQWEIRRIGEQA